MWRNNGIIHVVRRGAAGVGSTRSKHVGPGIRLVALRFRQRTTPDCSSGLKKKKKWSHTCDFLLVRAAKRTTRKRKRGELYSTAVLAASTYEKRRPGTDSVWMFECATDNEERKNKRSTSTSAHKPKENYFQNIFSRVAKRTYEKEETKNKNSGGSVHEAGCVTKWYWYGGAQPEPRP